MPFIELAVPTLRPGPEVAHQFSTFFQTAASALTSQPDIIRGFVGKIISEDGVVIDANENKPILLVEWTSHDAFESFLSSESFKEFIAPIKLLADAPAELQFFETKFGSAEFVTKSFADIIRVQIVEDKLLEARHLLEDLAQNLRNDTTVDTGTGCNMATSTLVCMIGWTSLEHRDRVLDDDVVKSGLQKLTGIGEVKSVLVEVEPFKVA